MSNTGLIGGDFSISPEPQYIKDRTAIFDKFWADYQAELASRPRHPISITLPDGTVKSGVANETSPMDIAKSISQGLADNVIIAKVKYTAAQETDKIIAVDDDEEMAVEIKDGELWDLTRPLTGDCELQLLKFDDPVAKTVAIVTYPRITHVYRFSGTLRRMYWELLWSQSLVLISRSALPCR